MTPVQFHFLLPNGDPVANTPFDIQLQRSDYDEEVSGVILPRLIQAVTDAEGKATVSLTPCDTLYHVTLVDQTADTGLSYKFYVPELTVGNYVRLQDIVVDAPMSSKTYDEAALLAIHSVKADLMAIRSDVHDTADVVEAAIAELPVAGPLPPANPVHGMEWTHEPSGRRYTWLDAWVETSTSIVVVTPESGAVTGGFNPAEAALVTGVATPATATVLIEEGGVPKRIEVGDFIATLGTSAAELSAAVDFKPTDYLIISQDDGVERRCTLAQLSTYLKTI